MFQSCLANTTISQQRHCINATKESYSTQNSVAFSSKQKLFQTSEVCMNLKLSFLIIMITKLVLAILSVQKKQDVTALSNQ